MNHNPYSISKLGTYAQCPNKFNLQYIQKITGLFSMNVALYKGKFIHKVLENKFDYDVEFETNEIFTEKEKEKAKQIIRNFENSDIGAKYKKIINLAVLEEDFAFKINNGKLELCDFWDKEAWCRGSADLYISKITAAYIFDYKSGKDKSEEDDFGIDQSMMYGIYMFLKFPEVQIVTAIFCFVEHSTEKKIIYTRDKLSEYIKNFYNKTKEVENDKFYSAKTSALCDYCDFYPEYCAIPDEKAKESINFMNTKIEF